MSNETIACFEVHKQLGSHAASAARRLRGQSEEVALLFRLAIACLRFAVQRALTARDEREAFRGWLEADLGERQIRRATYDALSGRMISTRDYDLIFAFAADAACLRRSEMERLRRRLRALSML